MPLKQKNRLVGGRRAFKKLLTSAYHAPRLREVLDSLRNGAQRVEFARSAGSLPSFVAAALAEQDHRKVLYIAPGTRSAERVRDDLRTIIGSDRALFLPPRAAIPYDPLHQNPRFDERAGVLERLVSGSFDVIVTIPAVLTERVEPLSTQSKRMIRFRKGDELDRDALVMILTENGMRREVRAEEPGHFAVRGGVIDIYPPSAEYPVRLELWGDEITDLREYDPVNQRSLDHREEVVFFAGEQGESERQAGLWELFREEPVLFIDDADAFEAGLEKTWEEIEYQYQRRREFEKDVRTPKPDELYFRGEDILRALEKLPCVVHRGAAAPTSGAINFESTTHPSYLGDLELVVKHIGQYRIAGLTTFILCDSDKQVNRLEEMLEERGASPGDVHLGVGSLHGGFTWPSAGIAVLTDHQVFGRHKRTSPFRHRRHRVDPIAFEQLEKGDFVVHTEFGIGRYLGLKRIKVGGVERECLQIEYRDGVKVYVRLDQFIRLQKYQGTDGSPPRISRIGGADWDAVRRKTRKAVEKMAGEIIDLYARRKVEGGRAFSAETPWQREMEAAFEFEDTPDQVTAAEQIKRDMEKPIAMDRLLCGDVGFGKTEVALRAAFKAVQDSTQIAVLVPTTILAQQHYATFTERLRRYPIRVEVLSRFRTRREQKEIVEGLARGEVDIVIGTHRLLSRDIKFKNLGLLIIDEEHRFGVKNKEKLKQLRTTVDVLTLTATPIPRTLHFALSGAKDMSMISTPPHDRHPIETEVVPFDERVIREAIIREVARGGQVYFLHNRVKSIVAIKRMLERLVPGISIAVAHGQMKERELEQVMDDFLREKYQVLVCTMIIESGLDIPNVNTLIVNRADRLGLAQLYQVRGRIGRSHRRAYAYLLTPPRMLLSTEARKRLETVTEYTRLGSGFQIAMRDLEIRGAGNLLGAQQSGFINQVGLELYTEMLSEAIKRMSDEGETPLPDVHRDLDPRKVKIDVKVDAMLPSEYVPDASERVEIYRRLSSVQTPGEVDGLREELLDRFGPLPAEAAHLLNIVEAQTLAADAGVARVDLHEDAVFIEFTGDWGGDNMHEAIEKVIILTRDYPVEMRGTGSFGLRLSLNDCHNWDERWGRLLQLLSSLPRAETWERNNQVQTSEH